MARDRKNTEELEMELAPEAEAPEVDVQEEVEERTQPAAKEDALKSQRLTGNQIKQLREASESLTKTVTEITAALQALPQAIVQSLQTRPAPITPAKAPSSRVPLALAALSLFFSLLALGLARSSRSAVVESLDRGQKPAEVAAKPAYPAQQAPVAPAAPKPKPLSPRPRTR